MFNLNLNRVRSWRIFRQKNALEDEVVVHNYPSFVFTLPLILTSYFIYFTGLEGVAVGWVWILLVAVTYVMCTIEVGRNATIVAALVVVLIPLLSFFISQVLGITVIGRTWSWFIHLAPEAPGRMALILALLLSIIYVIMYVDVYLNHRYVFSHNGLLHKQLGKRDVDMRWAQFRINFAIPNIPAFLLMGAGTIRVDPSFLNAQASAPPLYVIEHVPLLSWGKRRRIQHILSAIQVTSAGDVLTPVAAPVAPPAAPPPAAGASAA